MSRLRPLNWKTLPGPENVTRVELPNGITVLCRSNFNSPSVVISGFLNAGSLYDSDEKLGTAHFAASMLMRGTQTRSFQQIFDALETNGATLGFGASVHTISFGGRALAEDLPLLLGLMTESLQQPLFPAEQMERLRGQMLAGLAIRAQDTADTAALTFDSLVFAGHPYARPDDGYPETIARITRDDLAGYHRRHFGPRGMVVVVVGGIEAARAVEQVQAALGGWQNPEQPVEPPLPALQPLRQTVRRHLPLPGKSQTDLVIGTLGPRRKSPDFLAASLGNSILGQFGMMGRIGDVVREQAGLAYYASTSLNSWIGGGSWEVSAGVNPANLERAVELILAELRRFVHDGVTAGELADVQSSFVGRMPLSLESNGGVAGALLNLERFNLGLDYYQRYPTMVEAVTAEQILQTAQTYLDPERLAIISSGPAL